MTNGTNTLRLRSADAEGAAAVPRGEKEIIDVDATVVPVGTFAAGQSADGRFVAATAAPQGSFADGLAEEDDATSPERRETSSEASRSRTD